MSNQTVKYLWLVILIPFILGHSIAQLFLRNYIVFGIILLLFYLVYIFNILPKTN